MMEMEEKLTSPVDVETLSDMKSSDDKISVQEDSQEDDDDLGCYQDIMQLKNIGGITEEDLGKIRSQGIVSIKGLQLSFGRLAACGLASEKINILKQACAEINTETMKSTDFITAFDFCKQQVSRIKIGTGSENLDNILGGGIEIGSITEVFGDTASGKTQLCLTMCATAQIPLAATADHPSYSGGKVIFIDTENTFRPERVAAIANTLNLDKMQVLNNILYARAMNSEHQMELLKRLPSRLMAEPGLFKLLIVDSLIAHFKTDFLLTTNNVNLKRQQMLSYMLTQLKKLAQEFNLAVLVTNHVTIDMTSDGGSDNYKPSGGMVVGQASTTRIFFKRICYGGLRKARIYSSPDLEEREVEFFIGPSGIENVSMDN